jgi:large subunit ribosomal protein L21
MKAVIETGGKQYYVEEGTELYVEKLDAEVGSKVEFDKVLMVDGAFGNPYLSNAKVTGEVVKHGKDKKIVVFKYVPKNKYRKKQGHRQPYTKVVIKSIKVK